MSIYELAGHHTNTARKGISPYSQKKHTGGPIGTGGAGQAFRTTGNYRRTGTKRGWSHGHKLLDDSLLLVKGRLDSREDTPKLICSDLETFEVSNGDLRQAIQVDLPLEKVDEPTISEIKKLLNSN